MVIVVMGPAGAGKTTVGRRLAASLGWPFHEGDAFHPASNVARMRAGVPLGDAERAPWLAALADVIARTLGAGESAVLACSALKRDYRRRLVPPGTPAGAVRFVYLRADAALLEARLSARTGHYFAPTLLASQLAALEEPGGDEPAPVLTLDAGADPGALAAAIRAAVGRAPAAGDPPNDAGAGP
jgi:gluconokinase